jgi:hypothetical protein
MGSFSGFKAENRGGLKSAEPPSRQNHQSHGKKVASDYGVSYETVRRIIRANHDGGTQKIS